MPLPSDQSYKDFISSAYTYLTNPGPVRPSDGVAVSKLYRLYSRYDSNPTVAAKVALVGDPLYQAMVAFIGNANIGANRIIRVQSDKWRVMDQAKVLKQYQNPPQGSPGAMKRQARKALGSYLHIYPDGTKRKGRKSVTLPAGRPGVPLPDGSRDPNHPPNNWRIGINVEPGSMTAAVAALMDIMDNNADINHIKFSAPGTAGKPDSVIIYMRKRDDSYAGIRTAVQNAVAGLNIQHKFSPMWNEFADGFGEAAEPPKGGSSFGTYRCILAYLAYRRPSSKAATLSPSEYLARVDQIFGIFGIPLFEPHKQGSVIIPPYNRSFHDRFMKARALSKGKAADHYLNDQLIAR